MRIQPEERWLKAFLLPLPYLVLALVIFLFGLPLYGFISAPLKAILLMIFLYGIFMVALGKLLSYAYQKLFPFFPSSYQRRSIKRASELQTTLEWERLRRDLRYSIRKRNYFHRILRPQLREIVQQKVQSTYGVSPKKMCTFALLQDTLLRELLLEETLFQGRRVPLKYLQTLLQRIENL